MKLVQQVLDDPAAHFADEETIVRDFDWAEPGSLPPIAPVLGIDVIVDPSVPDTGPVLFAAGRQTVSLKVGAEDLFGHQPVQFSQISDVWSGREPERPTEVGHAASRSRAVRHARSGRDPTPSVRDARTRATARGRRFDHARHRDP